MNSETHFAEKFEAFIQTTGVQDALKKNVFRLESGQLVFQAQRFVIIIGLISVLIAGGAAFIPDIAGKIILMALFGVLGIPLLLYGLFARMYADAEKIVYRNLVGIKKQIYWRDVKAVYVASMHGDIVICNDDTRIILYSYYRGCEFIECLIEMFVPEACDTQSVLKVSKSKEIRNEKDTTVFRIQKWIGILCVSVLFLFWGLIIYTSIIDDSPTTIKLYMGNSSMEHHVNIWCAVYFCD